MRDTTTSCATHPGFIERLARADGQGHALPDPPKDCAACAQAHNAYVQCHALLRWRGDQTHSPLSSGWQSRVWMELSAADDLDDAPITAAPTRAESDKVVPFPDAARLDTPAPPRPRRWARAGVAAAAMWAAALAGGAVAWTVAVQTEGPAAHTVSAPLPGGVALPRQGKSHVALRAYSARGDRMTSLMPGSRIRPGDPLAFDYLNHAPKNGHALRYLTVIAAAHGQQPSAEPRLIWIVNAKPIDTTGTGAGVVNEEEIALEAPPGGVTIYGLFSPHPLPAARVETLVRAQLRDDHPVEGLGVARLDLRVEQ